MFVRIFTIMVIVIFSPYLSAQLLTKKVSLHHNDAKVNVVFKDIQNQTGAIFSYSDFDDNKTITIHADNKALMDVISVLEEKLGISMTVKEKYIIVREVKSLPREDFFISGKVINPASDEPLSDASVIVQKHKILVNTNTDGRFAFKVPAKTRSLKIQIAKENFIDTSLIIVASKSQNLHIHMRSYPREQIKDIDVLKSDIEIGSVHDNTSKLKENLTYSEVFWQKQDTKNANLRNVSDTFFNRFSISLLPPISTNKLLSFHTRNIISLNIIGGHSKGLSGVELAGVYNYDNGAVYGVQAAGVMNVVREDVVGVQLSGVINAVHGNITGVQAAGVVNYNDSTTTGVQLSGFFQRSRTMNGIQAAGFYNYAKKLNGGQLSGFANVARDGNALLQVAGAVNVTKNATGAQVSGLINYCDTLKGLQVGLINYSRNISSGLMIGLINITKNGYHKLDLSYNELGTATIGFRSGWAPLYLHYSGGVNLKDSQYRFLTFGAGIASSLKLSKRFSFEADINGRQLYEVDNIFTDNINVHNQALIGLSWHPSKNFAIKTGITFNQAWTNNDSPFNAYTTSLIPGAFDVSGNNKAWIGWQVGVLL